MDENRHRHTVWMDDNVWVHVESHYQRHNCTTKNEFIEKAVRFYSGYLDAESAAAYLLRALSDVLEGKLGTLGKRMGRLLAVEQSLMENVLAAGIYLQIPVFRIIDINGYKAGVKRHCVQFE